MNAETILIISENPQVCDPLVQQLIPSLGHEALVARDAPTALNLVRVRPPSLLLLDIQLKDPTALDLLRQVYEIDDSIITILIAPDGSERIDLAAFRLGVQDFLVQPLEITSLRNSIGRAIALRRLRGDNAGLSRQMNEQVEWLAVLSRVAQSITSSLEVDEVLRRIVEAGVYLTKAEEGFLALLDEQSKQLYLRAVKNIDQEKIRTLRIPVDDSLLGIVVTTGRPFRSTRVAEDPHLLVSTGFLVHSLLHVPLISKGRTLGVLSVDNRTSRNTFSETDEAQLTSLADYASVAIENASLYQRAQQEIGERRRMEGALRESEERYELAVLGANDGLWDWDLRTNQIYFSPRWKAMLGHGMDEIGADPDEWFDRIHPEDVERTRVEVSNHLKGLSPHLESEYRMIHVDGAYRWMLSRGIAVKDEDDFVYRMAGSQSDITARKEAEEKLLHEAFYDTLTNLPNRALFMDRLKSAIERSKHNHDYYLAVLLLDLDRFKDINESMSHKVGDELLIATARKLVAARTATDTVARLSGDEFVILLENIAGEQSAIQIAGQILDEIAVPLQLNGQKVFVSSSIGVVLDLAGYDNPEDVLRDADIAMYSAKANGKARFEIFDAPMRERIMRRLSLETELRHALENQELRLIYQPIVALQTGRLEGFEALVRWQHPEHGLLPPAEFIPLAEECGLIDLLDRWVLNEACSQLSAWQEQISSGQRLSVSVNISGQHIGQAELISDVERILEKTGLKAGSLKLEITESAVINDIESTSQALTHLRALGVQVQIDDFGVGYSSLSYLSNFPIDALKIDQSFIATMTEDTNRLKIVQAIVNLAQRLGVGVIAEGVETVQQLRQLQDLGCEFGQGFLISIPLEDEAAVMLLRDLHSEDEKGVFWLLEMA